MSCLANGRRVAVANAGAAEKAAAFAAAGNDHRQPQQQEDRHCPRHFVLRRPITIRAKPAGRETEMTSRSSGSGFLLGHAGTAILASRCRVVEGYGGYRRGNS